MSFANVSAKISNDDDDNNGVDGSTFCSRMRDNWVYIISEATEIATVEDQGIDLSSPRYQRIASLQDDPPYNDNTNQAATHGLGSIRDLQRARSLLCDLQDALGPLNIEPDALHEIKAKLQARQDTMMASERDIVGSGFSEEGRHQLMPRSSLDTDDRDTRTKHSETSSDAPSVLETYFEKARDIFVLKERLSELDHEPFDIDHDPTVEALQQCARREEHCAGDNGPEYSRDGLVQALSSAEAELEDLRQVCARLGIQPQLKRYRQISNKHEAANDVLSQYYEAIVTPLRALKGSMDRS